MCNVFSSCDSLRKGKAEKAPRLKTLRRNNIKYEEKMRNFQVGAKSKGERYKH